jgi:long-chain acyl-CoA synthetase
MTTGTITRPWLEHYPANVPAEIDTSNLGTIVDLFETSVAEFAGRQALESFGVPMTYAQLGAEARKVAASLQKMGLKPGDRAAIMLPNVMAYTPLIFGILMAGGIVVNVNPLYTAREVTLQLNDSGARVLFVLENFAHTITEALPELKTIESAVVVSPGDLLGFKGNIINFISRRIKRAVKPFKLPASMRYWHFARLGMNDKFRPPGIKSEDVAFLQYTGGTTGISKGATLLHRNIMANVAQADAWLRPHFKNEQPQVMITALPLYHIFALTACCLFITKIGGTQILIANPRDIPSLIKQLQKRPPTLLAMVNTLFNALARAPGIEQVDFSKLEASIAGGMATQAVVAARWHELTGKPITEAYGLSETSPMACANRPDLDEFTGTIGYPVSSTDVSIRSPEGEILPYGEPGEVCIRGPQVMAGYWQRPDETAKVMTEDGFFRSGDVGILQENGQVKLVDRIKDMIVVSGMKVFPNEVEDVLASHPAIVEAAVIGLPDDHSGEAVTAYVVLEEGAHVSAEEVRAYAREKLTPYKVPREVVFRTDLSKSNVGKILRRELREEVAAQT